MARVLSSTLLAGAVVGLLVGCAGGDPAAGTPATTAVAGDAAGMPTAKPIGEAPGGPTAGAVAASAANVPTVAGKVRYGVPTGAELGVGSSLGGGLPFPIDDAWNRDLVRAQPDPGSGALIAAIGPNATLAPGFGALAGVPYAVVGRTRATVAVRLAGGASRA